MKYGDIMQTSNHKKPYDYFRAKGELDFTDRDNVAIVTATGVLGDLKVNFFNDRNTVLGIYQELDLFINTIHKFTATQVSGILTHETDFSNQRRLKLSTGVSVIMLGGINSAYASLQGKDYNLGPGAAVSITVDYTFDSGYEVYANYKKYWIHTLSGAKGEEFTGMLNVGFKVKLLENLYLCNELNLYNQNSYYEKYKARNNWDSAIKTYINYVL